MKKFLFFLYNIFIVSYLNAGFIGDTLVDTLQGPISLKYVVLGANINCLAPDFSLAQSSVVAVKQRIVPQVFKVTTESGDIVCSSETRFFLPEQQQWLGVRDLRIEDYLLQKDGHFVAIVSVEKIFHSHEVFDVIVKKHHNFFANTILVHNGIPLGVALLDIIVTAYQITQGAKNILSLVENFKNSSDCYVSQVPEKVLALAPADVLVRYNQQQGIPLASDVLREEVKPLQFFEIQEPSLEPFNVSFAVDQQASSLLGKAIHSIVGCSEQEREEYQKRKGRQQCLETMEHMEKDFLSAGYVLLKSDECVRPGIGRTFSTQDGFGRTFYHREDVIKISDYEKAFYESLCPGPNEPCWCGCGLCDPCCGCLCGCICSKKNRITQEKKDANGYTYKYGRYVDADYHHANSRGNSKHGKSRAPKDGQLVLDNSYKVDGNTNRRVGLTDEGELVVFDRTLQNTGQAQDIFHGHIRTWEEICAEPKGNIRNAFIHNGITNAKGKILK